MDVSKGDKIRGQVEWFAYECNVGKTWTSTRLFTLIVFRSVLPTESWPSIPDLLFFFVLTAFCETGNFKDSSRGLG